jgi:hypothetical protein
LRGGSPKPPNGAVISVEGEGWTIAGAAASAYVAGFRVLELARA